MEVFLIWRSEEEGKQKGDCIKDAKITGSSGTVVGRGKSSSCSDNLYLSTCLPTYLLTDLFTMQCKAEAHLEFLIRQDTAMAKGNPNLFVFSFY